MTRRQLAARQAQWARFHEWEESRGQGVAGIHGEAAVRVVGEVIEFYLEASGSSVIARRSVEAKAEAIRRLRDALRFATPAR